MNIGLIQNLVKEDGIIFLTYGGFLSQSLISSMTEALENEAQKSDLNMGLANNIFTIFIELAQNMMNYSKNKTLNNKEPNSEGLIIVTKDEKGKYYIHSQNIVSIEDKNKLENKLNHINTLSNEKIKEEYKELRRTGKLTHERGGGIGFYEIAKKSDKIDFEFKNINNDKFYFHFIAEINTNKENSI